jgi:hypothetical protein
MFPKLPKDLPVERIRTWFGHRPSMPDGRPCLGYSRASRDVVYAFGHGHVGLVSSARTGRVVAQLIGGRSRDPDRSIRSKRFSDFCRCEESQTMTAHSSPHAAHRARRQGRLWRTARHSHARSKVSRIPGDMGNGTTWPFPVLYRGIRREPGKGGAQRRGGPVADFIDAAKNWYGSAPKRSPPNAASFPCSRSKLPLRSACRSRLPPMQVPWAQATLPPAAARGLVTVSGSLTPAHPEGAGVPLDTPLVGTENGREFFRVLIGRERGHGHRVAEQDVVNAGKQLVAKTPTSAPSCLNAPICRLMPRRAPPWAFVHDIYSMITVSRGPAPPLFS